MSEKLHSEQALEELQRRQELEELKRREKHVAEFFIDLMFEAKPTHALVILATFAELIDTLRGLIGTIPATIHAKLTGESEPMNNPGQQAILTIGETNAEGAVVSLIPATLTFVSTDPTVATVSANGDGNATVTFVGVGTCSINTTDTAFGLEVSTGVEVDAPPPPVDNTPTAITAVLGAPFTPGATQEAVSNVVKTAKPV